MSVARVLIGLEINSDLMNLPGVSRQEPPNSFRKGQVWKAGASNPLVGRLAGP